MNDELPYAIGYNSPLTSWVIAGPYAGNDEASSAVGAVVGWFGRATLAVAGVSLALLLAL